MNDLPTVPLPVYSVGELLASHADTHKDKTAIIAVNVATDQTDTLTYRQLNALVGRCAAWLTSLGIRRGDRFAILMPNAPEVIILELAGAFIGATTVPLDSKRDTPDRKIFKLNDTQAKLLLIKNDDDCTNEKEPISTALPGILIHAWSTMAEFSNLLPDDPMIKATGTLDDFFVILYTSGTTALPKGVLLTSRACFLNAMGIVSWQHLTQNDIFNIVLPLHHINSTEFSLAMIIVGGTIVLNSRYSVNKFWHIVNRYHITHISVVPTILHDLLTRADDFIKTNLNISSLKRICIGSAPVLPQETMRFYDTFNVRVTQGYGQTETALRVAGVPVEVDEATYRQLVKTNTIGTTLANNHLAIMDEQNNEKQESEEGEICIAGPILADGYLNNPEETAASFKDGWFHSGDLGYWKYMRDSGNRQKYFFIIGRIKEIIIKGGVNLSPSAIEDAILKAFPEIDEISVVGYPDARMGEEIAAVVVLKRSHLASQGETLQNQIIESAQNGKIPGLSRYEAPKKVFVFDSLPKTSTGKIQRVEIKKAVAELIKKDHPTHYYVRKINDHETKIIKQALKINNIRFPFVPSTLEEFCARTQNGLFFGVFDEQKGLVGSLSCVQISHPEQIKTWRKASGSGTLSNHNTKGNTLLCVAISVQGKESGIRNQESWKSEKKLQEFAKKHISSYVHSDKNHVLEFHRKPKGGIPGADVWKILPDGRPEDKESMGYNVLMKYPTIDESTIIVRSNAPSPAILLIEHALLYAKEHGIKDVIAFSRPAGFKKYLEDKSRI
ncbi:MAG: class I adenylate-forming enzyme family protein [Candidatus Gottesmanbacteria bacterium]|nr:class I adenylate-forming enzyme family protein [Candidatus Gottesmanbacteria bacterium]